MNYQDYIKPELLVLIPVLYFIGTAIKRGKISDTLIPVILGVSAVFLAGIYLVATTEIIGARAIATALFGAITQGILCAGASVYANQILKQAQKSNDEV